VAPGRLERPHDLTGGGPRTVTLPAPAPGPVEGCPFCPGAEHETPPEHWALRDHGAPDTPGWRVRAVPNRYPVITPPDGVHEVIVNCDRHVGAFWDLDDAEAAAATSAWALRETAVSGGEGAARTFLFLNQGAPAGASLQHTHAQLVGLPQDPPRLAAREAAFVAGPCPVCAEAGDPGGPLVVATTGSLVAWCPRVPPLTGVVTNTQDSGPGSLRAALYYAFDHPGATIRFSRSSTPQKCSRM